MRSLAALLCLALALAARPAAAAPEPAPPGALNEATNALSSKFKILLEGFHPYNDEMPTVRTHVIDPNTQIPGLESPRARAEARQPGYTDYRQPEPYYDGPQSETRWPQDGPNYGSQGFGRGGHQYDHQNYANPYPPYPNHLSGYNYPYTSGDGRPPFHPDPASWPQHPAYPPHPNHYGDVYYERPKFPTAEPPQKPSVKAEDADEKLFKQGGKNNEAKQAGSDDGKRLTDDEFLKRIADTNDRAGKTNHRLDAAYDRIEMMEAVEASRATQIADLDKEQKLLQENNEKLAIKQENLSTSNKILGVTGLVSLNALGLYEIIHLSSQSDTNEKHRKDIDDLKDQNKKLKNRVADLASQTDQQDTRMAGMSMPIYAYGATPGGTMGSSGMVMKRRK